MDDILAERQAEREARKVDREAHEAVRDARRARKAERDAMRLAEMLKKQHDEEAWYVAACANVMHHHMRVRAAIVIQRRWRKYSSDPSNDVGLKRMVDLWLECLDDPIA